MRANSIKSFRHIAIMTKNLESARVIIVLYPSIKLISSPLSNNRSSVDIPFSLNMINDQELKL